MPVTKRSRSQPRRLEALEARQLLAAVIQGDTLTVETIVIEQNAPGMLTETGMSNDADDRDDSISESDFEIRVGRTSSCDLSAEAFKR